MNSVISISQVLQPSTNDHSAADGELSRSAAPITDPTAPRNLLARIDAVIQRTENKQVLNLLIRAWWKEWFRVYCERKTA